MSPPMDGDYSRTAAVIDPDAQASKHVAAHRADELVIKEGSGVFADRDQLFKAESMVVEPPAIGGLQPWIMGREFLGVASQEILADVARLQYLSAAVGLSPQEQRRSPAARLPQLPGKDRKSTRLNSSP